MTRLIERWFPCQEVSENSDTGWGSGGSEKNLFTWFAARPLAQAKAAVICSLLPWPDDDPVEQARLRELVRRAMTGRDEAHDELVAELAKTYPNGASMLDPYSGRAMFPLEAARLGVTAWGIDYSPVATLAGTLLADYPLRDWSAEPPLPFDGYDPDDLATVGTPRLLRDVEFVLNLIGDRYETEMDPYYPVVDGKRPWGYLWAVTLPCQNCGNRFPLTGSLVLRHPLPKKNDEGQSYRIVVDRSAGTFHAEVHAGPPKDTPTLVSPKGARGKAAVCPFCEHSHTKDVYTRLMRERRSGDVLLVVADLDDTVGKAFRTPTDADLDPIDSVSAALAAEPDFAPGIPARPDEQVPAGNNDTVRPSLYGYTGYGEFCNDRQTLGFVRLARIIDQMARDVLAAGGSPDYAAALTGYAASVFVRRMRQATRGATLRAHNHATSNRVQTHDIFINESAIAFNFDYFEVGPGRGPATWRSVSPDTVAALRRQMERANGKPATILRGSAASLPMRDESLDAVVTDPPYDAMIDYSDASDLFYVWLKRALVTSHTDFGITSHPLGVQEKSEEAIVKRGGKAVNDHRNEDHYDRSIAAAFTQAARKVREDGVVTVVFGHGDPDVWHRLLSSISAAGLVLTGSWPARTEKGGKSGAANIETTLTLACRPAASGRPDGRVAEVDAEVKRVIAERRELWDAAGLALTDQLMASAGPAMEVVGRYERVLDKTGEPVSLDRYLPLARRYVAEAAAIKIDSLPLETFDLRTRFALFWVRLNGRSVAPGSEARWHRLAYDMDDTDTAGLLAKDPKGVRFVRSDEVDITVDTDTPVIDVALAVAAAGKNVTDVADILLASGRLEDRFLWAAMGELSARVPEADPDGEVWTWVVRNQGPITGASRNVAAARDHDEHEKQQAEQQGTFFGGGD